VAIFLTGATGYIGAHIAANLLEQHEPSLNVLVRAHNPRQAEERLWRALQLHMNFPRFYEYLQTRVRMFCGDLTRAQFGLERDHYDRLVHTTDSVIHCAASLNRKSEKSCLNVNLRGTLEVVQLAMRVQYYHGLRRFSHVSTVAVAGKRQNEIVTEDQAIDWDRSDYDPYARTKKFCEHMIRQLLPEVPITIFRPSIVLGDSRRGETTQFDMVRAFVFLAGLPVLPFRANDWIDIVNVDFVANAVAALHQKEKPLYSTYHLSSGRQSQTFRQLTDALAAARQKRRPIFIPALEKPFSAVVSLLANGKGSISHGAALKCSCRT
jgi:thioester reductase-like protein